MLVMQPCVGITYMLADAARGPERVHKHIDGDDVLIYRDSLLSCRWRALAVSVAFTGMAVAAMNANAGDQR
jgi:hypothetical protein